MSASILFSLLVFLYVNFTIPILSSKINRLTEVYALTALFFLYITLLATPLTRYFPMLPYRGEYIKARRALGVSACYFALLHASSAFFFNLGGFAGLSFLSNKYIVALSLSFTALLILLILAATANDKAIEKLGFARWKAIHRLVYLAGILTLIHAVMLGTHFAVLSSLIPKIVFSATAFLLILEARRFDEWVSSKFSGLPNFGITGVLVISSVLYFLSGYVYDSDGSGFGIHSKHIIQARKDIASGVKLGVSFSPLEGIVPARKQRLMFRVFNESTGETIKKFALNQEKIMHVIIVGEDFNFFDHIHPEFKDDSFFIDYAFPKEGKYRVYADYVPEGMGEQYRAFQVKVGTKDVASTFNVVENDTASNGIYVSKLTSADKLKAKDISAGKQLLSMNVTDSRGNPVENIETYLAAFGHMVMINTSTYEYVHVHPKQSYVPYEGETSGPLVEFSPLGIYSNIKPGVYKLYVQFKIDGKINVFDYFVRIN